MESVQVKSYGYGGLLSCAVFFSAPHPVTEGWDIFSISLFFTLPLSISLFHICTGERDGSPIHVGGRLESQVCLAGGRPVDGSDGRGPASLLSGETDSKHTNIQKQRNSVNKGFTQSIITHNDL